MFRSVVAKQRIPLLAGLALGGAAALYFSQSRSVLRADAPGALRPDEFVSLPLKSTKSVSADTKELVFELPEGHTIGGKVAFMVFVKAIIDGDPVARPYTPISSPDTVGSVKFVIKAYKDGKMSPYISSLKPGDKLDVKGPIQKFELHRNEFKKIALLGGGSGITPLFQVMQKVANDPEDKTEVSLFYGNKSPEDVLIKDEIDALVAKKPDQLKAYYFVDKGSDGWKGEVGHISKEFLEEHMFKHTEEKVKAFVCGPPGLMNALSGNKEDPTEQGPVTGALGEMGFHKGQVFKF